jgi:hypothetical protein
MRNPPFRFQDYRVSRRIYSMLMASTGHTSTQAPQSPQVSASTTAKLSFIAMASNGHDSTQVSQPVHFSGLTTAGMNYLPMQSKTKKIP